MENEQVTIALTVAQWQTLLDALGHAPYVIVNSVGDIVGNIQAQAAAQIATFTPAEPEASGTDNSQD